MERAHSPTSGRQLLEHTFSAFAKKPFLFCTQTEQSLTYAQTGKKVRALTREFEQLVPEGDPVAFLAGNSVEYIVVLLALVYSGRSVFLFSPDWPEATVRNHLSNLGVAHLVTDMPNGKIGCSEECQLSNGLRLGHLNLPLFDNLRPISGQHEPRIHVATSGTTGLSKWVPKTLTQINTNLSAWGDRLELSPQDKVHSMLPLCTANGVHITILMPFFAGASVVVDRRFSMASLGTCFENMLRFGSTVLSTVPTILYTANIMLSDVAAARFASETRARLAICGTAPLSFEEKFKFADRMGVPVLFNFGTTETLFVASQSMSDWESDDCGQLLDGMNATIESDGELRVWTHAPFLPYWNHPAGGFQPDGSYLSGDLGKISEGQLSITGRKTDMVIVGGFNVHPVEIDRTIISVEGVLDCFTFGTPSSVTGEELISTVVIDKEIGEEVVITQISEQLAAVFPPYKVPRVEVVTEIAKTPTGKPIKREMQQRLSTAPQVAG